MCDRAHFELVHIFFFAYNLEHQQVEHMEEVEHAEQVDRAEQIEQQQEVEQQEEIRAF